ncbi:sensor histidine kinase [Bradyrhizobium ivorense]|uniref:sensor histidine kinase n=1 Tax=Bradyrhizobium ivorense TaxID=2511166 RepID=UPI0010BBCAF1|nr:histidine kinase [Bradyrhizobium ivorense]VIO81176.1 Oxygen sensor histidine kinase NreB [Bradyrhizobium ivorense]
MLAELTGQRMIDLSADLLPAAEADVIGLAVIGADRRMVRKIGRLVEWLPAVGADCCECMLLVGMEAEFVALAEGRRDMIALAGVRGAAPGIAQPVTAVVLWNDAQSHYFIIAMPDFAARQVETLLGSERRARRLMEQQLEAASAEVRFASLARTRLRLARDLHDTLVHSIVALLTQIRLIRHYLSTDPARVADGLATAEDAAASGLQRAREAIACLRMPDDLKLDTDIEELLTDFAKRSGVKVSTEIDDRARAGLRDCGLTIQRILGEALRNVQAHAEARHVAFRAFEMPAAVGRRLVVEVRDDGRGFDPAVPKPGHFGLIGMAEFAELVGGTCAVQSAPGQGTVVRISLPVAVPPAASSGVLAD